MVETSQLFADLGILVMSVAELYLMWHISEDIEGIEENTD